MQFAALVKKYQPHFYVNGHDHVMCYFNAKMYGYSTQFFTSGASLNVSTSVGVSANGRSDAMAKRRILAPGKPLAAPNRTWPAPQALARSLSRTTAAGTRPRAMWVL